MTTESDQLIDYRLNVTIITNLVIAKYKIIKKWAMLKVGYSKPTKLKTTCCSFDWKAQFLKWRKIKRTTFCQFWDGASLQSFSVHGGLWQSPQALSALVGLSGVDSDSTDDCSSGSSSSLSLQKKQKQISIHATHLVSILSNNPVVNFPLGMNQASIYISISINTSPV